MKPQRNRSHLAHHKSGSITTVGLCLALAGAMACGKKKEKEEPAAPAETTPAAEVKAPAEPPKPAEPAAQIDAAPAAAEDTGDAPAEAAQDLDALKLESAKVSGKVTAALEKGKILAHGESYPAEKYCNEDTTLNPDGLEVFSVSNNPKQLVYLCVGSLDGVENVVSIFEEGKEPLVGKVKPPKSSHRAEDEDVLAAVKKLLASR